MTKIVTMTYALEYAVKAQYPRGRVGTVRTAAWLAELVGLRVSGEPCGRAYRYDVHEREGYGFHGARSSGRGVYRLVTRLAEQRGVRPIERDGEVCGVEVTA